MRRILLGVALVALLIVPMLFLHAADSVDDRGNANDPRVNDRANACYTGGAMEGKCSTEDEWIAGWYLIRFQYGILTRSEVPEEYRWVLPADPITPTPTRRPA